MAFLAGLLNLPVFVPSNLAVLLECRCSCSCMYVCADDTSPPPACPSVQVRSSTRLWRVVRLTVHQLLLIRFLILYVMYVLQYKVLCAARTLPARHLSLLCNTLLMVAALYPEHDQERRSNPFLEIKHRFSLYCNHGLWFLLILSLL